MQIYIRVLATEAGFLEWNKEFKPNSLKTQQYIVGCKYLFML